MRLKGWMTHALVALLLGTVIGAAGLPSVGISPSSPTVITVAWEDFADAVYAESGCTLTAYKPRGSNGNFSLGLAEGTAAFSCGSDAGSRYIEACIRDAGLQEDCDGFWTSSAATSGSVTAECHQTSLLWHTFNTRLRFIGEDGVQIITYSATTDLYNCDYGVD